MAIEAIPIVIGVVCIALIFGYIADLAEHPEITLKSTLDEYDGTYTQGSNITDIPAGDGEVGSMFGFIIDIPILGDILSFVSWILTQLINMICNVASLPGIFPNWMSPIFAIGFMAFIIYIYVMIAPTK